MNTATYNAALANLKSKLHYGDLVGETMDQKTVRFMSFEPDGMVNVADVATGKILPDLRRPEHIVVPNWVK